MLSEHLIREELVRDLAQKPNAAEQTIIHELGICVHTVRVDVATVDSDLLCGFEIKSDEDTLKRLPKQARWYDRVFDLVTIVTTPKHVANAIMILPPYWGVTVYKHDHELEHVRAPSPNPNSKPYFIAQFLWRDEALEFLRLHNVKGYTKKDRRQIWEAIEKHIPIARIRQHTRLVLRSRRNWLSDKQNRSNSVGSSDSDLVVERGGSST